MVRRTVWFFRRKKVTLFGMTQKRMNDDRDLIELNYHLSLINGASFTLHENQLWFWC